jgi:hypothetical protein
MIRLTRFIFLSLVSFAAHAGDYAMTTVNTLTVDINASPKQVYTLLLDRKVWMDSFVAKKHISGPVNEQGDISDFHADIAGQPSVRREELAYAVPGEYLVIRMSPEFGTGFAHYRLVATDFGTRMELSVLLHLDYASFKDIPGFDLSAMKPQMIAGTQSKITADHHKLKTILESKQTTPR